MKRNILFALSFFIIAWVFTSCEILNDCESCKLVTTDLLTGDVTESQSETEYCGADLIAIRTKTNTSGNIKTAYKCH
jgi:hypothetical protein